MNDNFLNRSDFAKYTKLSPSTVTRFFNGKFCSPTTVRKILRGLNMSMSEILTYIPNTHSSIQRKR
ncbi:MAG: helix-turn-helix transcriptional regulator [Deltaproteobacteria bacterium]|nr:helix-turn-helix transcriptional regulator [Deltaproteobacteria bacterium]